MNLWRLALALLSFVLLCGCVSDEPKHTMRPQPKDVQPTRVGVWAMAPEDTDANGYLDTVIVTVYVSSDQYPAPIAVPGSFEFRLLGKEKKELAKWDFSPEQAATAVRKMPAGPAYFFRLSVLDVSSDKFEAPSAHLTAEFRPTSGQPVRAPLTELWFGRNRP